MAKKRKKSGDNGGIVATNEFTTLEVDGNLKPESSEVRDDELSELLDEVDGNAGLDTSKNPATESPSEFLPRLTQEMKDKLDRIDALEKHCLELEETNAKLTDSVNAYIEELEQLKSKKAEDAKIDGEFSLNDLKNELDAARKETSEMRKSLKELRDENDCYLMKISELTFENAKLTSQLQEIEKSMAMAVSPTHHTTARKAAVRPSHTTMQNRPQFANPYLQNGYQDW